MSTCLTTVLDGVVNDKDLRKPGELRIIVTKQENYIQSRAWLSLGSYVNQTITLINDKDSGSPNYFFDAQGTNLGTSVDLSGGVLRVIYCTNGNYEISIPNKYMLYQLNTLRAAPQMDFFTIDIEELKYNSNLMALEISGTTSKGDIKALATCSTLNDLTVERTNVKGDLEDLSTLENLLYMRFAWSQNVTGNLAVIENMPLLRNFETLGCIGITGNISSFASCPELRWVCTPCVTGMPSVEGNISAFANAPLLQHLEIRQEPKVTGNINVVANNTSNLVYLSFAGCNVEGDIADLENCNRLTYIDLQSNKNVTGDLGVFLADKPLLTQIGVSNTGITGDISNISIPAIVYFYASTVGITGTIGAVEFAGFTPDNQSLDPLPAHEAADGFCKHSPSLAVLSVSNTQISGDIDVLVNCPAITSINVYNSNITGNVASLASLSALISFNIGFTHIHGDIGVGLSGCTNLKSIYVEQCPYVYGDLSQLPNNLSFITASAASGTFSWQNTRSSSAYIIAMQFVNLGDDLDAMLINQASCTPDSSAQNTIMNAINVRGNRSSDPQTRTAANAAIITLMNKGYSVTINGILQTDNLVGNDVIDSGN